MMDASGVRLTIRQTCKLVYPFIHVKTIYLWIREGVFTPILLVQSPSGPGGGTELDFTDLVTVGVLHSLFQTGVQYRHLVGNDQSSELSSSRILFCEPTRMEDPSATWHQERVWGRRLQEFLERHWYDVSVYVRSSLGRGGGFPGEKKFLIRVCGSVGQEPAWNMSVEAETETGSIAVGHMFVMAREWMKYVQEQLKLNL